MPRTKTKSNPSAPRTSAKPGEVLTLAEAAAYLRAAESDVLRLVREQGLPGRKVGDDWRFLKAAVAGWLGTPAAPDPSQFWQTHFGALQDDPDLREIVREAYRKRGRPADGEL
jgi:excisionase family DNA binding protein